MLKERSCKKRLPAAEGAREQTLDARHAATMDAMQDKQALLAQRREQRAACAAERGAWTARIGELRAAGADALAEYDAAWTSNLRLHDALDVLEADIRCLESCQEEIDYFVGTGSILFEYYDLLERQNVKAAAPEDAAPGDAADAQRTVPAGRGRKVQRAQRGRAPPVSCKSILQALRIEGASEPASPTREPRPAPAEEAPAAPPAPSAPPPLDKQSLVEKYMVAVDPTWVHPPTFATCGECERCRVALTCLLQEGVMVCAECGYQELMLVEQNKPIHRQPCKETSHFSYKRINHFNEWVSQLQGKESTEISDEVFERILAEIRKERIDPHKITYNKMREILKKTHNNKYYEHVYYIIYRINGIPAPNFSQELEEKLRSMFKEIQGPFLKHCPAFRRNFLSYSYCLYKLFQLLEKDEYLKYFHLLKSREKLHQQDQVWRKICDELGWQFIESI